MNNDSFSLIFAAVVLLTLIVLFIRIAIRIRKHGGSLTMSMFASTYEMYDKEKRAAIEQVVEQKVKKMEDDETDEQK
jgi:hypothetical protein